MSLDSTNSSERDKDAVSIRFLLFLSRLIPDQLALLLEPKAAADVG